MKPAFNIEFQPLYGQAVQVADNVIRITAPNKSPFTFHGTNSYIVGKDTLAIIDPGPDDSAHLGTMMRAVGGRRVSHIFVTHTHMDHSPLASALQTLTGAKTVGYGPHTRSRSLTKYELGMTDSSSDFKFSPDIVLNHDEAVHCSDWTVRGVFTPGHTANHMAFALEGSNILFSGDHVMAWSTTIIAPPDGSMHDYLASLDLLLDRKDKIYFPGHGGPVLKPKTFVRALKGHRLMREASILARLKAGDQTIAQIVKSLYKDTNPRLHDAAALTVFAHLERLTSLGLANAADEVSFDGRFKAV